MPFCRALSKDRAWTRSSPTGPDRSVSAMRRWKCAISSAYRSGAWSVPMTLPAWWHSSCPMPASTFPDNPLESMVMSKPSERPLTAIIGSGFIGRAWAISFARAGCNVRLWDQADGASERALDYISGVLDDLAHNDLLNGAE